MKRRQIRIWLFSRRNMNKVGECTLKALGDDPELGPEHLGPFEPYEIDIHSPEALNLWQSQASETVGLLGCERKQPARIGVNISFGMTPRRPFHTLFWSADMKVLKLKQSVVRIEKLFHRLVNAFGAYWGAAFDSSDFEEQNVIRNFQHPDGTIEPYKIVGVDLKYSLPGLYWLNYFGSDLCEYIGDQTIKSAVTSAESLDDGLLIKIASSPTELLDSKIDKKRREILVALGEDLFFDISDPTRHTRAPQLKIS